VNRYSVYKDGSTVKLVESKDEGKTWSPYHLNADTAYPIADALNAWHSEDAVESLSAFLEAQDGP
jgi:hypothetical protein